MSLVEEINRIRTSILEGRFSNESSISQGIVLPILQSLGWQTFDVRQVSPEYTVGGRRVDFALLNRRNQPVVFIEVKMLGNIEQGEQQLFEYAFHQGVPFLVLTDGKEWNFYLPLTQGNYQDRKVYKLDLIERDIETIIEKLTRYLLFDDIISGSAYELAKNDLSELTRHRMAQEAIPHAWRSLLINDNEKIIELLVDKVEDICGIKPDKATCEEFLESMQNANFFPRNITDNNFIDEPDNAPTNRIRRLGYNFEGHFYSARSAREVMIGIIKKMSERDPTFLERFARRAHSNQRNYISRNRMELYPNRPDLCNDDSMAREFLPGWWIGLNYSKNSIEKIIKIAFEVSGIRVNNEFQYYLGR